MTTLKLYKVTCQGLHTRTCVTTDTVYGICYVVARDPNQAYRTVRDSLDRMDVGQSADRELKSIELIAENADFPDCLTLLHVAED